jgi:hypothetical protein
MIASDGTRLLLPVCGISYKNIVDAACECGTLAATAKRLGVGETTLRRVVADYYLGHWFTAPQEPRCPSKLTRRRLKWWLRQNMTRKDVAAAIGCSYAHLNTMLRRHRLTESLPNRGTASWVARTGVRVPKSEGLKEEGRFLWA